MTTTLIPEYWVSPDTASEEVRHLRTFVRFHYRYISEVPIELVIVQTKADNETIGNLEAAEVHTYLNDPPRIAVQKGTHAERIWATAG